MRRRPRLRALRRDDLCPRNGARLIRFTWVATAAIIPLLCWDAWQTYKEARLRKHRWNVKLGPVRRDGGYMPRLDEQLRTPVAQEHGRNARFRRVTIRLFSTITNPLVGTIQLLPLETQA